MAESSVQSNNKAVTFRGRPEREMATKAKQAAEDALGVPMQSKPAPNALGSRNQMPMHIRKKARRMAKRGLISAKAMRKMSGEG